MKTNSLVIAIVSVLMIFAGIFVADLFDLWQTESSKIPTKFTTGAFEGQFNPDDIKGSYSFADVENAFGVEASIIAEAFGMTSNDPASIKVKDVEGVYGELTDNEIGTGSVKKFVSLFTDLPYEDEEYLPKSAVLTLEFYGKWNDALQRSMADYIVEVDTTSTMDPNESSQVADDDSEEEISIKGKTSVADAISYGLTLEEIEAVLGVEVVNENMLIRDICEQNGLSFSAIKDLLNKKLEE